LSKEQVSAKLDSSQEISSKGFESPHHDPQHQSPHHAKETIETVAAAFKEEATAIDKQIQDLGKSILLNHLLGMSSEDAEAKAQQAREAEKRRIEAELRKARLKEKAARDPHKKIQLRLENKRRFEMHTLDKAGIPTKEVDFQNHLGCETIKMVDVLSLRTKCQGLSQGIHSVQELVEMQQRRERALRLSSSAPSLMGGSTTMGSSLMMGQSTTTMNSATLLPSEMSWEERFQKASHQRRCVTSETIVRKLNSMRAPPDRLPQAFDVFDYCNPDTRGDWGNDCFGFIARGDSMGTTAGKPAYTSEGNDSFGSAEDLQPLQTTIRPVARQSVSGDSGQMGQTGQLQIPGSNPSSPARRGSFSKGADLGRRASFSKGETSVPL